MDPIEEAMDRGSDALYFANAPLVMNYMDLTFSRTIPRVLSRHPFKYHINPGLYIYSLEGGRRKEMEGSTDLLEKWYSKGNDLLRYSMRRMNEEGW